MIKEYFLKVPLLIQAFYVRGDVIKLSVYAGRAAPEGRGGRGLIVHLYSNLIAVQLHLLTWNLFLMQVLRVTRHYLL